jgi:cell division transport system permease protein
VGNRGKLLVSEAWRSLGANLSTTVAATMTVLIGMFLLGLFIALGSWTLSWSDHAKRQLEVKVFFVPGASSQQRDAVARMLEQNQYVKPGSIDYVSPQRGLEIMKKRYPELVKDLPSNPLGAAINVTPDKPEDVDKLYDSITKPKLPPGVDRVRDGKQVSHYILRVAHVIEVVFTIATVILLVASVLLIANTIRLSIFSRRREIEVMKLVGATNWFVRGPFMLEGLICGLVGSIAAVILLLLGKEFALPAILGHVDAGSDVSALPFSLNALALLLVGLGLGAAGSGLTLRRFLRV